jgi:hypothetical protein
MQATVVLYAGSCGMFVYSSSTRGWANLAGDEDPRPDKLQTNDTSRLVCVASTLRAERTGAGATAAESAGLFAAGSVQAVRATACRP